MSEKALYGGQTADERREERRRRLLGASLELLGHGGWDALRVRQVCAGSGLTARYFYEGFSGRGDLAVALFDELAAEATQAVISAVQAAPAEALDKARAAIGAFVDLVAERPSNAVVLFAQADGLPELMARRVALTRAFAGLVESLGRDFYGLEDAAGLDTAATMLAGGLAQTLLDWSTGALVAGRDALIEDCAVMFVAAGEAAVARVTGVRAAGTGAAVPCSAAQCQV